MNVVQTIFLLMLSVIPGCLRNRGNSAGNESRDEAGKRPNVLLICIDDLRPELGCYGNKFIKSPNIDRIANHGYVFTNHFSQVPTSGASRACLLTGMLPRKREHLSNNAIRTFISGRPESENPETFIHHLRKNGYYTVGVGKISHFADGLLYEYNEPVSDLRELPYSWDELSSDPGKWGTGWNAFFGYADGTNRQGMNGNAKPYEKANVDDEGYPDGLNTNIVIKKLQELAKNDAPFFLGVGFYKPHLPFNAPSKYWDLYDEKDIPLSPNPFLPKNVSTESLHGSKEFNSYLLTDESPSLQGPISDEYARKLRHAYFACISYVDAQVGRIIDELERLDLSKNTILIIWGDHGWHLGDHLIWGKHSIFERALKSAFIIKIPGSTGGEKINEIVSTIDIYPSIIELCGLPMPHETDGKSFVPLINDPGKITWKNQSYGYFNNGISFRNERFRMTKYFRNHDSVIELFDHLTDPNETINIALDNPALIDSLMPLLEKGNTGLYDDLK